MSDSSTIATDLEVDLEFAGAIPGDKVSDDCMAEIVKRLRVSVREDLEIPADVKISSDSDNILEKTSDGSLLVRSDTFCSEEQQIPIPSPSVEESTRYIVPIADRRIVSIILKSGVVTEIPNGGQTLDDDGGTPEDPDDDTYTYPLTLQELADNLNDEVGDEYTWTVEGGQLIVESDLDEEIVAVMEKEEPPGEDQTYREVTAIEEEQPGDVEITFLECAERDGIEYDSVFSHNMLVTPGDGYSRYYPTVIESDKMVWKFEGVTKVLDAKLNLLTPTQREASSEL